MTETTELLEAIPFTAWQQMGFVVLVIVTVVIMFYWFGRQSDNWQTFIESSNDKWRQFSKEQREQNQASMTCVENSLNDLTTVTQALVSEVKEMRSDTSTFFQQFNSHDNQAKEILAEVKNIKPATRSRSKPKVLPNKVENEDEV